MSIKEAIIFTIIGIGMFCCIIRFFIEDRNSAIHKKNLEFLSKIGNLVDEIEKLLSNNKELEEKYLERLFDILKLSASNYYNINDSNIKDMENNIYWLSTYNKVKELLSDIEYDVMNSEYERSENNDSKECDVKR